MHATTARNLLEAKIAAQTLPQLWASMAILDANDKPDEAERLVGALVYDAIEIREGLGEIVLDLLEDGDYYPTGFELLTRAKLIKDEQPATV